MNNRKTLQRLYPVTVMLFLVILCVALSGCGNTCTCSCHETTDNPPHSSASESTTAAQTTEAPVTTKEPDAWWNKITDYNDYVIAQQFVFENAERDANGKFIIEIRLKGSNGVSKDERTAMHESFVDKYGTRYHMDNVKTELYSIYAALSYEDIQKLVLLDEVEYVSFTYRLVDMG